MSHEEVIEAFQNHPKFRYLVFQKELGEENQIPHYQGYVEFSAAVYLSAMSKILGRAHWETRRGPRDDARKYCMKEDTRTEGPWEAGEYEQSRGHRSDLDAIYKMAREGAAVEVIGDAHPALYLRYYKAVTHVRRMGALTAPGSRLDLKVSFFFGPPRLGKTRLAYARDPNLYSIPIGKDIWYDGYTGQNTLLIDDFSGQMRLVDLLRALDVYPVQVPVKGDFVWLKCKNIILTSNVHPKMWYDYTTRRDSQEALFERFHEAIWFPKGGEAKRIKHESFFYEWFENCIEENVFQVEDDGEDVDWRFPSPPSTETPVPESSDTDNSQHASVSRPILRRTRPTRIGPADSDEPLFGQNRIWLSESTEEMEEEEAETNSNSAVAPIVISLL